LRGFAGGGASVSNDGSSGGALGLGGDGARVSCSDGSAARLAWPAAAGGGSGGALGSRGGGALSWAPPSAYQLRETCLP